MIASAFGPGPGGCASPEHVQDVLRDLAVAVRVKEVVDGPKLVRRNAESEDGCGPWLDGVDDSVCVATLREARGRSVGNNLGLCGDELAEFVDFFGQETCLGDAARKGELDVTPSGSAVLV